RGGTSRGQGQALVAAVGNLHGVAGRSQGDADELSNVGFVVYDQYAIAVLAGPRPPDRRGHAPVRPHRWLCVHSLYTAPSRLLIGRAVPLGKLLCPLGSACAKPGAHPRQLNSPLPAPDPAWPRPRR